ncbi:alpha/beta fold hydrolase [Teichococcus wenyumeiae]|uniref:alpha/beta fold hydrolase n=1 Tax=Teichococcus wenyumeiae TaxID=2478470 RepID=UPI001F2AE1AF|nr:alpha/beta hydrolase [Pseudoroseomonas wenyumeiae]
MEVNGVSLRYALEGEGPVLVLVHEIGGSLESWDGVVPELARRFRVLRYDQRGAGGSEKPRQPFGLKTLVEDLDALLAALSLPAPFHLVGAAMGAAQAVMLAARRPRQVASLALLNPALEVDPARAGLMRERARRTEEQGLRATLAMTLDRSWPPDGSEARARYRGRYLANDPYGFARQNEALLDVAVEGLLGGLTCPVLLLAGTRDAVRPPQLVRRAAQLIPGSRLVEADAAHFTAAEAPAALLRHLRPFHDDVLAQDRR